MSAFLGLAPLPKTQNVRHPAKTARRRRLPCVCTSQLPRRDLLRTLALAMGSFTLPPAPTHAYTLCWPAQCQQPASHSNTPAFTVFSVVPTSVSDVNLTPLSIDEAIDDASSSRAVFVGEHHNSLVDHALQAKIIDELRSQRPVVVGLEMVQQRFQPSLDKYVAGEISELDLYVETEWDQRWVWPYELYLPVLRLCRKRRIPLVALSLDSEILAKVRAEGGIENLSSEEMRAHIGEPAVFAAISREPAFKRYISEIITPSYASHFRMGLLRETANFNSFYTARVLRDEAMATRTVKAIRENPDAVVACLIGSDHVKFEYGVKVRVQGQLLAIEERERKEAAARAGNVQSPTFQSPPKLRTVLLNPGPADAYDPDNKSLKLEMTVDSNPVPIADYLWFSSLADAKPRRRVKARVLPPVEVLTSL